ncbi:AraC family transcriptional regulator [Chitinophaga rhizophila]|uniref:Helix-turn-helix transcriptional regulator n=1 Tax=Chitinophaga rhizophila TaxID=2866212 RepID=A0ABS7GAD8_9BACT|nr:helix-turn-helix transcriptional regulator [Chitinophaga rhizophila]MBW8684619.1 helix-turn-helix transcriptional regulator [Chitinophaga rhizophila]
MVKKAFPVYDVSTLTGYKDDEFQVSRFAPYLRIHENLVHAHKHSFYHVTLFTQGGGTHTIDFKSFTVRPYQIYFMIPGQVHSWQFEGDVDGYIINFSVEFLHSLLQKPDYLEQFPFFNGEVDESVVDLPESLQAPVTRIFEELLEESEQHPRMSVDMIQVLMLQLFIRVGRISFEKSPVQPNNYNYILLKNFQKLIEKNFSTLKLPKDYAELLFITPNHLNALCNNTLGLSAGELIRNRIILEAKRMLVNVDATVTEIAYRLGFADNSYFTKFYKKYTGQTPEEFRRKLRINH